MKEFIKRRDAVEIRVAFGGIYGLALVFGIFPPAYLWASGSAVVIAGLPVAIWYWILIAVLVGLSLWALYWVEDIRGELDETRRPNARADHTVTDSTITDSAITDSAVADSAVADSAVASPAKSAGEVD